MLMGLDVDSRGNHSHNRIGVTQHIVRLTLINPNKNLDSTKGKGGSVNNSSTSSLALTYRQYPQFFLKNKKGRGVSIY